MDSLFPPLFVTLIVCLFLECLSLALMEDIVMAGACRTIFFMLLGLTYTIKRDMNHRALYRRYRRLFEICLYQYIILIVCVMTMLFHAFLLSLVATRLYSVILWFVTLFIVIDEYQELQWLQEYQRRLQQKSVTEEEETIILEPRMSIYSKLFTMPIDIITRFTTITTKTTNVV